MKKNRIKPYSPQELKFVDSMSDNYSLKEIVEMFNKKFNRNINVKQLTTMRYKHNLNRNKKNRYSQQEVNFIKECLELYNRDNIAIKEFEKKFEKKISYNTIEMFRKRYNIHIRKRKTIGQEGIKNKRITIKMPNNKWALKHRLIYEKHYGKIPKGYYVAFIDGNNRNFNINNLKLIKDKTFCRIARYKYYNENIMDTYILATELVAKAKDKIKEKKR